jgi:hypothetical protein
MNRSLLLKWRTAVCLFAAGVLLPVGAAMDITEYDKMVDGDRQAYLDFLVDTVQQILMAHGRNNDAAKTYRLFHGPQKGEPLTEGEKLFKKNLDSLRTKDAQKHYSDPNAPRVQVEAALMATLKENKITLPTDEIKELLQMSSRFKPRFPADQVPAL